MASSLRNELEELRLAVYHSYAETGRAPSSTELSGRLGLAPAEVADGLHALATLRHVVLDREGRIAMAHPFSAVPLGFAVMGASTLWWGGCAWDSFALPHLLADEREVLVATTCPGCGAALAWVVSRDAPPEGDEVAHFLVPAARMWDDVVRTCEHQRLFCGEGCVNGLAGADRERARRRSRPGDALAARATLVRRAPRARLRSPRACAGGRVFP
jgi:hypothetical protein